MFYNNAGDASAGAEGGNNRVPGSRVLQNVDVPWTAPGSSECEFRMLRSHRREGVSVAKLVRLQLRPGADWSPDAT